MSSPLYKALLAHIGRGRERLYMPGHKGKLPAPLDGCAPYDVTELELTGCLYDGEGPPAETEDAFSRLYQTGATLLSAGGATLCIQAMLSLFCPPGSRLIIDRRAHHSAVNACALLGLSPVWLLPDEPSGILTGGRISPAAVAKAAAQCPDAAAVYITSPDYFGTLCDIKGITEVCRAAGKPLLVDNAHGAHLKFFGGLHPMEAGADCCCDSLHKTLPALTGGALLHLRDGRLKPAARRAMRLFGSTSPSYLIMLSCDMLTPRWSELGGGFRDLAAGLAELKAKARSKGVLANDGSPLCDPARIALAFPEGWRHQAAGLLGRLKIEAEYISPRHIILLPSPGSGLSAVERLIDALPPLEEPPSLPDIPLPKKVMEPRQAALSEAELIPAGEAAGRTAASPAAPCPPCVAIVMPGELIDHAAVRLLESYGVERIWAVKHPL